MPTLSRRTWRGTKQTAVSSHNLDHEAGDLSSAELQAAEWALRRRSRLGRKDQAELETWLNQDPSHRSLLDECEATSAQLDRLRVAHRSRPGQPLGQRRVLRIAAGIAALVLLSAAIFWGPQPDPLNFTKESATSVGKFKRMTLPDGTQLTLNTDSAVEIVFEPAARRVRLLKGEAYFKVAHAPERPFWVEAAQVHVKAVGTAFNVRYHSHKVEVTVTEGRVALNDTNGSSLALESQVSLNPAALPAGPETIAAGARATVLLTEAGAPSKTPVAVAHVPAPSVDSALAWQSGRLEFSETPLAEVVSEFNRYNRHRIVIEDPDLALQKFGGAFAFNGHASFIELLERNFNVISEQHGETTVLRRRR